MLKFFKKKGKKKGQERPYGELTLRRPSSRYNSDFFQKKGTDDQTTQESTDGTTISETTQGEGKFSEVDGRIISGDNKEIETFSEEMKANSLPENQMITETFQDNHQQKNAEWFAQMRQEASQIRSSVSPIPEDISAGAKAFTEEVQTWMIKTLKHFIDPSSPPFVILALGSFARKEMAPYSDMDFIVICEPENEAKIQPMLEAYGKAMRQNLLDRHGGFNIDDVTGSISSPEGFVKKPGRDALLIYQSSPEAKALYEKFQLSQRNKASKSDNLSLIVDKSKELLNTFNVKFLSKRKRPLSQANVKKDFLEPILTPIAMLAEYYDLQNGSDPDVLTTAERLNKYIDDKNLSKRMLNHFDYFLKLRYMLHNESGKENDELLITDKKWQDFKKRAESFRKDYEDYVKFIKKKTQALKKLK